MKRILILVNIIGWFAVVQGCSSPVQPAIDYCAKQATRTLEVVSSPDMIPNSVDAGSSTWKFTRPGGWTCGFWPGELWYLYEGTGDTLFRDNALKVTDAIVPVAYRTPHSHDVGFMVMPSIGSAYRFTGEKKYLDALVSAADSLVTLYNPKVGSILSWPNMAKKMGWRHNTIIDNMLNLELLFWVAQNCDRPDLYEIAFRHAETTMKYQFRDDWSTYHVTVFDPDTGEFIAGHTHQGWKDETMWARGQAWAVYGFTMAYRFTRDERFLETAVHAVDAYLSRLPEDGIPYWDFDAGEQLESQPKDCSAAAIVASALLELQSYLPENQAKRYLKEARRTIKTLSAAPYRAGDQCSAFLLHATGHLPNGYEIDASISYADYYYIEALIRLKTIL